MSKQRKGKLVMRTSLRKLGVKKRKPEVIMNKKVKIPSNIRLKMKGPYEFTTVTIDEVVKKKKAGNYALGHVTKNSDFTVKYVGRSDSDVKNELKVYVDKKNHNSFSFSYADSIKSAFEMECKSYHGFGGKDMLENEIHPARPNGKNWKCPINNCDELD